MAKVGLPIRKDDRHYTYRDYRDWPEDERWELINGVAYSMSSPTTEHQRVSRVLSRAFAVFLDGKPCEVFYAPLDVFLYRLKEQDEADVDTVVQPDLVVVCDKIRIRQNGIWGAPDLVVEILSPSTSRKDLNEKFNVYQRSGVKEYWVVDPPGRWLQQYVLNGENGLYAGSDGKYQPEVTLIGDGTVTSAVLDGFTLDIAALWSEF